MDKEKKEEKIKNYNTALADIQKRADERKKVVDANNKILKDKKAARSAARKPIQTGDSKLFGLASFASTTTRKKTT
jgi:chromosome condensin MukBEF ATPase and DNA-binding subunit MukB